MRVCFVVGAMNVGGVQTFIINLGAYLRRQGDHVTVLVTDHKGEWWHRLSDAGMSGISVPKRDHFCPASHALVIANTIRSRRFDVVVLNHSREAQLSIPLCSSTSIVVPVIHNDTSGVLRLATRNSSYWHYLIAVSPRLAKNAAANVPQKAIVRMNYPVAMPDDDLFANRASWSRKLRLLYVGRLHEEQKGVLLLPAILESCLQHELAVTLEIVGSGVDQRLLRESFKYRGLLPSVRFHGTLTADEVLALLLESHVLLMPSHYEGLGIVAVEAQACGCVPIVTRLPGVTDYSLIDGATGFLVDGHDAFAYTKYVAALATAQSRWNSMSQAGRRYVQPLFGIESVGASFRKSLAASRETRQQRSRLHRMIAFLIGTSLRDWYPNVLRPGT